MELPKELDLNFYKNNNSDIKNFSDEQLTKHFFQYGINEGRISNFMNRQFIKNIPIFFGKCIEICPFSTPLIRGNNVKYFDTLSREDLIKIIKEENMNTENIPFIHYVSKNNDLNIINEKFDACFSSHSIENQPDLIKHFKDVSKLLNEGGYYFVVCYDKRYSFDHFIPNTTLDDVITSNNEKRTFNTLTSVIEHRSLVCHNDPKDHWSGKHGSMYINNNINFFYDAIKEYNNSQIDNKYINVRAWKFTPNTFLEIINNLYNLKYIDMKIEKIYHTLKNSFEFIVVLKK